MALATCLASPAIATRPSTMLEIANGWSRATSPRAVTGGGYVTIVNKGDRADRLLGATSPRATRVNLHAMSIAGGVMRMRPLGDGLVVPPHGRTILGANGDHLMLEGLRGSLKVGEQVPLMLRFETAGFVQTRLRVIAIDAPPPVDYKEAKS